ncbi:unnamed protein product [Urochloa decumbens]|uniref:Uncharacterized protein n=1 Tax=Urochloa decumbens TaxID=240449 RepID=A0ABC8XGT2_9POAL
MARRCGFLPLPWLLLLLAVLGDALAARPLLGIAEPPASPSAPAPAPGPVGASRPGGGGGRPDRSVAGADVILVGFAAAVVVVIFLYIRVTRKSSGGVAGVGAGEKQDGGGLGGF